MEPEHAVIVHYRMSSDGFGTAAERDDVRALGRQLTAAIGSAGNVDGHEFGAGEAMLYAYGPDAARLFAAMEPSLRAFPLRPARVVLRFGDVDDAEAVEQHIDL